MHGRLTHRPIVLPTWYILYGTEILVRPRRTRAKFARPEQPSTGQIRITHSLTRKAGAVEWIAKAIPTNVRGPLVKPFGTGSGPVYTDTRSLSTKPRDDAQLEMPVKKSETKMTTVLTRGRTSFNRIDHPPHRHPRQQELNPALPHYASPSGAVNSIFVRIERDSQNQTRRRSRFDQRLKSASVVCLTFSSIPKRVERYGT